MKTIETKKLAKMGLFTALAMIFGYVEALIPIPIGIPGVKLGLANVVVVFSLYTMDAKEAFFIDVGRILLIGFTFGNLSMLLYSLAGGILSFLVMALAKRTKRFSVYGVSVLGGVFHNIGQLVMAMAVLETVSLVYYGPVLLLAGLITGLLIGILSGDILKRIGNL